MRRRGEKSFLVAFAFFARTSPFPEKGGSTVSRGGISGKNALSPAKRDTSLFIFAPSLSKWDVSLFVFTLSLLVSAPSLFKNALSHLIFTPSPLVFALSLFIWDASHFKRDSAFLVKFRDFPQKSPVLAENRTGTAVPARLTAQTGETACRKGAWQPRPRVVQSQPEP
jgi:hypothetical protein